MPVITLNYTKNTTGEIFGPPSNSSVEIVRWDGQSATTEEVAAVHTQYGNDRRKRLKQEMDNDYVNDPSGPGEFYVNVARSDGLPLTLREVDVLMLMDMMKRNGIIGNGNDVRDVVNTTPVIKSPRSIQGVIGRLGIAAMKSWFEATQQLEPGKVPQLVVLSDPEGAKLLLSAGIIERYDGPTDNQYTVSRKVAYCSLERIP